MGDFHYEYEMPAMTADIAVFTERAGDLYLLLIRRGNPPFEGCYALPGGFVEKGETVDEAAARELAEETGVTGLLMDQLRTFSRPGRDPRGWTITTAFYLLADEKDLHVQAGDDARAAWFDHAPDTSLLYLPDDGLMYRVDGTPSMELVESLGHVVLTDESLTRSCIRTGKSSQYYYIEIQ